MKKAGIGIDPYKLEVFKKELTIAGYEYTVGALTKDILMIYIHFEERDLENVKKLIRKINLKAKSNKDQN